MASNLEAIQGVLNFVSSELNKLGGTQQNSKTRVNAQEAVVTHQLGNVGGSNVIAELERHKKACETSIGALQTAERQLKSKIAALQAAAKAG
jgi:chaperonin cofactor prefoldin